MIPRGVVRLVLVFLALAAIGGCGSTDTISREELVSRGDSICDEYNEKFARFDEVRTLEALAEQTADARDLYEEQLERLRGLDAPPELQEEYDEYLTTLKERNEILSQAHEAAEQGNEQEVARHFDRGQQVVVQEQQLAQQIGFKKCSFPPPPPEPEKPHEHPTGKPEDHEHPTGKPEDHEH